MRALASKKAAVVRIEAARRRLRPQLRSSLETIPGRSRALSLGLMLAFVVALLAAVIALKLGQHYFQKGNLLFALLTAWPILVAGLVPLFVPFFIRKKSGEKKVPRPKPVLKLATNRMPRRWSR
jgi:hypothetical protein